MKKILYIRLDSSPLPEASDEIIIKDFNLESYFCTLLGKRLLEEAAITQSVPFPGKIVTDFKDASPEAYRTIVAQWENMLVQLLVTDAMQSQRFEINIPFTYFDWLSHHENPIYRELGKIQSPHLFFKGKLLYEDMIACVLMKRLRFTLSKITDGIDHIVVSPPIVKNRTPFISYIMQLNDKFNGLDIIDRQMFIDSYVTPKIIAEKKKALEIIYELSSLREGRIRIRDKKTKKYGFVDEQMELVVPCEYDFCGHFVDGLAFAYDNVKGGKQIDKSGNIQDLPSCDCYEVYDFSDGLARVRKDTIGNYAYWDKESKEVINVFYPGGCGDFKEGLAIVVNANHKYGFIDKTGAEVIPCQFDYASDFSEGLAIVEINKNKGFIDKTGKIVIPCKYRMVRNFSEGLACVFIDKWEFIDKVGRTIITCGSSSGAFSFFEGLAAILKNEGNKIDFIDKSGRTVFSTSMRSYKFSEGLAASYNGNAKIGYIDKTGEIVIPNIFEEYCALYYDYNRCDFSNGLALVEDSNCSRYFINKKGKTVVPPDKYRDLRPFHDGLACANGGYIDNKGNEIIPSGIFYNQNRDFSEGMTWIAIFVEGKYKYVLIKKEWFV